MILEPIKDEGAGAIAPISEGTATGSSQRESEETE